MSRRARLTRSATRFWRRSGGSRRRAKAVLSFFTQQAGRFPARSAGRARAPVALWRFLAPACSRLDAIGTNPRPQARASVPTAARFCDGSLGSGGPRSSAARFLLKQIDPGRKLAELAPQGLAKRRRVLEIVAFEPPSGEKLQRLGRGMEREIPGGRRERQPRVVLPNAPQTAKPLRLNMPVLLEHAPEPGGRFFSLMKKFAVGDAGDHDPAAVCAQGGEGGDVLGIVLHGISPIAGVEHAVDFIAVQREAEHPCFVVPLEGVWEDEVAGDIPLALAQRQVLRHVADPSHEPRIPVFAQNARQPFVGAIFGRVECFRMGSENFGMQPQIHADMAGKVLLAHVQQEWALPRAAQQLDLPAVHQRLQFVDKLRGPLFQVLKSRSRKLDGGRDARMVRQQVERRFVTALWKLPPLLVGYLRVENVPVEEHGDWQDRLMSGDVHGATKSDRSAKPTFR